MHERQSQPAEIPLDWQLARQVLGPELLINIGPDQIPHGYDERLAIVQDVSLAAIDMRHKMYQAAQRAGIEVTPAEAASWRPATPDHMDYLRQKLAPSQKRLDIVNGLAQLYHDKTMEAEQSGVPLRPHQSKFMEKISDFALRASRTPGEFGKSGVLEGPTGIGKTAIFAKTVAAIKYGERSEDPVRVLVLVPTQKILGQTMGSQGERGFGKFAPHIDVGAYYQDEKDLSHEVTVMCNASFDALCRAGKMPSSDVVIVDEAHTVIGEVTGANLREYMKDKLTFGFTATPEYGDGRNVYDLFEHNIDKMKLPDAVKNGLLAPVRGYLRKAEPKIDPATLPIDPIERKRVIRQDRFEARCEDAMGIVKQAVEKNLGVIVRCPPGDDIVYAAEYAARLRDVLLDAEKGFLGAKWIVASHVGGSTKRQSKADRQLIYDHYDQGDVDVLTYVKAIGLGYDSPHAKVFINLDPSESPTEMIQADGRVMRLTFDNDGKPVEATLYDYEDPELGDRQYTCLDVLNTRSGELLDHDPIEIDETRTHTAREKVKRAELIGVNAEVIGTTAISHNVKVKGPSAQEIAASMAARKGNGGIDIGEACRILGIKPPSYRQLLREFGSNPEHPVNLDDLLTILSLRPQLQAADLPQEGFVPAIKLPERLEGKVRAFNLTSFARTYNIQPRRLMDPETGMVGFYYEESTAERIINLYKKEHSRKPKQR